MSVSRMLHPFSHVLKGDTPDDVKDAVADGIYFAANIKVQRLNLLACYLGLQSSYIFNSIGSKDKFTGVDL